MKEVKLRLIDEGYLSIDLKGFISISHIDTVLLVGQLYKNDVLSYWFFPDNLRVKMDDMIADKAIVAESRLFTRHEISYFNFLLNKKEFTNGAELRNKYLHGTNSESPEDHKRDYQTLLIILILMILKISDELKIRNALHRVATVG